MRLRIAIRRQKPSQLDEVIRLAREFFALPLEEKNKVQRFDAGSAEGGDGARGYQGLGDDEDSIGLQDMQEAIDWYRKWPADKREPGDGPPGSVKSLQGTNLWPERPKELKPVYEAYIERVMRVGEALVSAMGVALELGPGLAEPVDWTVAALHVARCLLAVPAASTPTTGPLPAPSARAGQSPSSVPQQHAS